jgi:hypothetical protein
MTSNMALPSSDQQGEVTLGKVSPPAILKP